MIQMLWDQQQTTYASLDVNDKGLVFFVPLESFAQKPWAYLHPLAEFIGSSTTSRTEIDLRRQRCPRKYEDRTNQIKSTLEQQISLEERSILLRLVDEYETLLEKVSR